MLPAGFCPAKLQGKYVHDHRTIFLRHRLPLHCRVKSGSEAHHVCGDMRLCKENSYLQGIQCCTGLFACKETSSWQWLLS